MPWINKPMLLGGALGVACLLGLVAFDKTPDFVLVQKNVDPHKLIVGTAAPSFRLESTRGGWVGLEDLKGKTALLVFVTTTCPYCKALKEEVLKLALPDGQKRLIFVSRKRGESPELAPETQVLEEQIARLCPVLQDTSGSVFDAYKAGGVPTAYRIDARGRIQAAAGGSPRSLELVQTLAEELGVPRQKTDL